MKSNFDACLAEVLKHEGGYVNHPQDPGGMTNLGVTKKVWEEWTGQPADEQIMRSLTPEKVTPLYKKRYWDAVKGDDLPIGIDLCVFDCAVNSGVSRSARFIQSTAGVTADGVIGPKTIEAINSKQPSSLISDFCAKREAFYRTLPTFATFGKGWMNRLDDVEGTARKMLIPTSPK